MEMPIKKDPVQSLNEAIALRSYDSSHSMLNVFEL